MKALVLTLTLALGLGLQAQAQTNFQEARNMYYSIGESELKEIPVDEKSYQNYLAGNMHLSCQDDLGEAGMVFDNGKSSPILGPVKAEVDTAEEIVDGAGRIVDGIINIGKKIWAIIEAGKPVANLDMSDSANALPRGVKCWDELSNWEIPSVKRYSQSYKNLFGVEVVRFEFDVIYTHGGQLEDVGSYLTNVQVHPKRIHVAWGFDLDASVEIPSLINLGSSKDPVAGMQVDILWRTSSPLIEHTDSASIFVTGSGEAKIL